MKISKTNFSTILMLFMLVFNSGAFNGPAVPDPPPSTPPPTPPPATGVNVEVNGSVINVDAIVHITGAPDMPIIRAKLLGSPSGNVTWKPTYTFNRQNRNDNHTYNSSVMSAKSVWDVTNAIGSDFFGGTIKIEAVQGGSVCDFTFHIRAENPTVSSAEEYIGTSIWYAKAIARLESGQQGNPSRSYLQFNEDGTEGKNYNSQYKNTPNRGLYDYNDWGMFQLNMSAHPEMTPDHLWNWKSNVDMAKDIMSSCQTYANRWMNAAVGTDGMVFGGQRVQAKEWNNGVSFPIPTSYQYGTKVVSDTQSSNRVTFEDAVAIKSYNGNSGGQFAVWNRTSNQWVINQINGNGLNYVKAVCLNWKSSD